MESLETIERFRSAYSDWCARAFSKAPDPSFADPSRLERSGLGSKSISNLEDSLGCRFPTDFTKFLATTRARAWLLPLNVALLRFEDSPTTLSTLRITEPPGLVPIGLLENEGVTLVFNKVDKVQPELPIHALDERQHMTKFVCSSFSRFLAALTLMMKTLDPLQPGLVPSSLLAQLRALDPTGIGGPGVPLWSRMLTGKARSSR